MGGGEGGGACRTWQQRPDQFNQCFTIHTILILSAPDGDSSPTALSPLHPAPHTATRVGDSGHNLYHNPFLYTHPPPYSHQTARLGTCTVLIKRTDSENKLHQQKLWMEEKSIFCQRIPPPPYPPPPSLSDCGIRLKYPTRPQDHSATKGRSTQD